MEALAAKLASLSYEIFGIFLPGLVGAVFFLDFWWALGAVPPAISRGSLPEVSYALMRQVNVTAFDYGVILLFVYFLGHLLYWLSRNHGAEKTSAFRRVISCLLFRIPRPQESFHEPYKDLMDAAARKFYLPIDANTWRRFYPLAKVTLAQRLSRSLVSTYQNTYTLHRSITTAAALLFWSTFASVIFVLVFRSALIFGPSALTLKPRWPGLAFNLLGSLGVVWGFSDSFAYNWKMFGNTVITETFAILCGQVEVRNEVVGSKEQVGPGG
jgi:hypothetical protein